MEGLEETTRKVGRPTITEQLGITDERIISLYKEMGTIKLVADYLKVSTRTLRKYLRRNNVTPTGPRPTARSWLSKRPSEVYNWMREYALTGLPVPRNTKRIAELSNCTRRQVQDFVERRRKAAKKLIESKGTLPEESVVLTDTRGRRFKVGSIGQYTFTVDTFDLTVKINCVLRSEISCVVQIPYKVYIDMLIGHPRVIEGTESEK